jgi:predicted GNAT family N-acyltransferase
MISLKSNLSEEEKFQIYRLRYRVYIEELGHQQKYANHKEKIICEPLDDDAHLIGAFLNNQAVGTIRCNIVSNSDIGYYHDLYKIRNIPAHSSQKAITTKLIVDKEHRNRMLTYKLLKLSYQDYLRNNIKYIFSSCEQKLQYFYQKYGWKPLFEAEHPELGKTVVMLLDVFDFEYLRQINSPFLRNLKLNGDV